MRKIAIHAGAALMLAAVAAPAALADGKGAIKYRQKVMAAVGGHTGAAALILKGQGGQAADLAGHAHALAELAKVSRNVFPAGSGPDAGKTGAKEEIWAEPDAFAALVDDFVALAAAFSDAAASGDMKATGKALGALAKNGCKACHEKFREKHSH